MGTRICVVGTGYVGLLAAVGFADFGNTVIGVDVDAAKVRRLNAGESPIYEPGVEDYLKRNLAAGRLSFSADLAPAIRASSIVLIAVGTPSLPSGETDLGFVLDAVDAVGASLDGYKLIVIKSTVPVGTNRKMAGRLEAGARLKEGRDFDLVSNPEFLREGKALEDFFHPDRIVIGAGSERAAETLARVYRALNLIAVPIVRCSLETAELIKYASNAFLATKIAFINEMANLAEAVGADIHEIARTMGMDGRIGPKFLHPGPGFGGSCFPKDLRAIAAIGDSAGVDMGIVKSVLGSNEGRKALMVAKARALLGAPAGARLDGVRVAVLGLAFKQGTDDVRESPAMAICGELVGLGASVRAHDPKAMDQARSALPALELRASPYEAAEGADLLMILTEWNEYRALDLDEVAKRMRRKVLLDARNLLDPREARGKGFSYASVGRA